ncbi:hypothetical protein EV421DRAFT_1666429, partial [Armillaria borealis]
LHIVSHILRCWALYCFNYMPGVGRTCGNMVEGPWDKTKHAGRSLKQMNHSIWHDTLDFLLNHWNWGKVI